MVLLGSHMPPLPIVYNYNTHFRETTEKTWKAYKLQVSMYKFNYIWTDGGEVSPKRLDFIRANDGNCSRGYYAGNYWTKFKRDELRELLVLLNIPERVVLL